MNAKIIVKSSSIEIHDYDMGDCPTIEGFFKVVNRVDFTISYLGLYYDKEKRIMFLPRGLDVPYIERAIGCQAYFETRPDDYGEIGSVGINTLPRDERQATALRFMLGVKEYERTKYHSQLQLNLGTGVGKTYIAVATAAYMAINSIIITYSVGWLKQWIERIQEYTNIQKKDIMLLSGANSINMILNGKFKPKKIYLTTHSTIQSYAKNYGWDKITELFKVLEIGVKFYDEAHLNFMNTTMIDFYTNTYKTFYLTATPARSDPEENKKYFLYMKNIPAIDLFDAENDPHTHYFSFLFNSGLNTFELSQCKNKYGLNRTKYIEFLMNKPNFWKMAFILMDFVLKTGGKSLFYIGTNEQIAVFYDWIVLNFPWLREDIGIYTSVVDPARKVFEKEKRIILSTTKSAGAAEDIKGLKVTVVLAEPFASEVIARQTLGRTRDRDTYYIELVDLRSIHVRKFYYKKLPIFEKYALDMNHVQFTQQDMDEKSSRVFDRLYLSKITPHFVRYRLEPFVMVKNPQPIISFTIGEPNQPIIPFTFEKSANVYH